MDRTLYLNFPQKSTVFTPQVHLQDICTLSCADAKLLNQLRVLPICRFSSTQNAILKLDATEILAFIHKKAPDISVSLLGEPEFLICYQKKKRASLWIWCKTIFVCITVFFGSAFSIMAFNNDVDTTKLFSQIHLLFTGKPSDGFTPLELSYSVGIGLGILFFYNHFGKLRFSREPSPIQIQMTKYEEEVNSALLKQDSDAAS